MAKVLEPAREDGHHPCTSQAIMSCRTMASRHIALSLSSAGTDLGASEMTGNLSSLHRICTRGERRPQPKLKSDARGGTKAAPVPLRQRSKQHSQTASSRQSRAHAVERERRYGGLRWQQHSIGSTPRGCARATSGTQPSTIAHA